MTTSDDKCPYSSEQKSHWVRLRIFITFFRVVLYFACNTHDSVYRLINLSGGSHSDGHAIYVFTFNGILKRFLTLTFLHETSFSKYFHPDNAFPAVMCLFEYGHHFVRTGSIIRPSGLIRARITSTHGSSAAIFKASKL